MNRRSFIKAIAALTALAINPVRGAFAKPSSLAGGRYCGEMALSSIARGKILEAVGTVNSKPFAGVGEQMVLFLGCSANREISPTGLPVWRLNCTFQVKAQATKGWNHIMRPIGKMPIPCRVVPGIYATTNFTDLFGSDMRLEKVEDELGTKYSSSRATPTHVRQVTPESPLPSDLSTI